MKRSIRRLSAAVLAVLFLAGAGCKSDRAIIATPSMMPPNLAIMPGLAPSEAAAWRVEGSKDQPIIDTHWRTAALFDQVEAFYRDFIGKNWGLATHTVETKDDVTIYWGLSDLVRGAPGRDRQYIRIAKAQTGGETAVEIVIEPRTP